MNQIEVFYCPTFSTPLSDYHPGATEPTEAGDVVVRAITDTSLDNIKRSDSLNPLSLSIHGSKIMTAYAASNRETVFDLRGELLTVDHIALRLATPPVGQKKERAWVH